MSYQSVTHALIAKFKITGCAANGYNKNTKQPTHVWYQENIKKKDSKQVKKKHSI